MRKLCCVLLITVFLKSAAQDNPCNTKGVPYSTFPQDTTIILPSGTKITFNRCEYFDLRDCIQIIEITDTSDLITNNLNMMDRRGNLLVTCGMLMINLKNCDKTCFEVPVKVKVKVRFQECIQTSANPRFYVNTGSGWDETKKDDTKLITENNERFIEFTVKCPFVMNCDVPVDGQIVKFIAPKGQKVEQVKIGTNCPLFFYKERPDEPKRRVKLRLLCFRGDATIVQATLSSAGSQSETGPQKLSALQHGKNRISCNLEKRSFFQKMFGWLGKKKHGEVYKKYYF